MPATLHVLRPASPPLAGFLRVGHTGHRKLEVMHAAGRLPYRRIVFEAAHMEGQQDLLRVLKEAGSEIVVDTNFAEMAAPGKFQSSVSHLPWANPSRPWEPSDFGIGRNLNVAQAMAEFAVRLGATAVLAPTHLVQERNNPWRKVDRSLCESLRYELDRAGGSDIAIDYQLIITNALFREKMNRAEIIEEIRGAPVENIWFRVSGFGNNATGAGVRHYIEAARDFHSLGQPLVADGAGGFAGLALLAFGGVGGISHGVAQKESFDAGSWRRPPSDRGGGLSPRAYVAEFDRYFDRAQLEALLSARGARSQFVCNDTACCRHGSDDMLENGHSHFITQRDRQLRTLSTSSEGLRSEMFILRMLDPAIRAARIGDKMKFSDEAIAEVVNKAKTRLIRFRDVMADLNEKSSSVSRTRVPPFRGGTRVLGTAVGQ